MSKFVKIRTQLRHIETVKHALDDLKIHYEADATFTHMWSGTRKKVELVVSAPGGKFALARNDDGTLEAQGDSAVVSRQKKLLAQVSQRYAYHMVLAEANKAGFSLVEEKQGTDQTIRLTVRRWA